MGQKSFSLVAASTSTPYDPPYTGVLTSIKPLRLTEIAKIIKDETPNADLRELVVDLGSQQSVRQAAAEVLKYPEPVDVLILNAGMVSREHKIEPQ